MHADPSFETFYWHTKPYVIAIAGISGTVSTWFVVIFHIHFFRRIKSEFKVKQQLCFMKIVIASLN